jgi:hypothetical protein
VVAGLARFSNLAPEELHKAFASQRATLRSYLANIDPPLAADRILDELDRLDAPTASMAQIKTHRRALSRWVAPLRGLRALLSDRSDTDRKKQKFPAVRDEELRAPLEFWTEAGILSRMPQITRLGHRLWGLH